MKRLRLKAELLIGNLPYSEKYNYKRIIKFLVVGVNSAIINFSLLYILIDVFQLNSHSLKNLMNLLVIEFCAVFSFLLNRVWTWFDTHKKQGKKLFLQYGLYNLSLLLGIIIRVVLFSILDKQGLHYLFNAMTGIIIASIINYSMNDLVIFKKEKNHN
jgi:putative flippase GtrA